jgi:putative membrane protein
MKNNTPFKTLLFETVIITVAMFSVLSCNDTTKANDNKKVAEQSNEATTKTMNMEKDAQFLAEATVVNVEEIKLGQLAQKKSTTKDVKDLGKMMEDEHTKALSALTALASKKSITIPSSPITKVEQAYNDLSAKTKTDFDKSYSTMMVDGHKNAIALFEKAAVECNDAEIKQWASSMLPDLRTHLDMATTTQSKVAKMK